MKELPCATQCRAEKNKNHIFVFRPLTATVQRMLKPPAYYKL